MIKNDWKYSLAVSAPISNEYPSILRGKFTDMIKTAGRIGFQAVEIHTGEPSGFPAAEVMETCRAVGIGISAVSSGMSYSDESLSVIAADSDIRKKARARFYEYIDLCSSLNCMLILGLMRGQLSLDRSRIQAEDELAEFLEESLPYAAQKDVVIVLEPINRFQNNFMTSVKEVVDYVKRVGHPNFKAHLDTFHMNIEESDFVNAIHYAGDEIGYVHFSDSNRKIPGYGHIDFYAISRALKQVGYKSFITIECLPFPDEVRAAELSIDYLKNMEYQVSAV